MSLKSTKHGAQNHTTKTTEKYNPLSAKHVFQRVPMLTPKSSQNHQKSSLGHIGCPMALFGIKKLCKKCRAMVRLENLGLRKTHTPKLVASLLKQLVYVPAAPFSFVSKFFLHYPNARNLQTSVISPHLITQFVFCV